MDTALERAVGSALQRRELRALRTAVRMAWRAGRGLVPEDTRVRYYRRYRGVYKLWITLGAPKLFFPERRPFRK